MDLVDSEGVVGGGRVGGWFWDRRPGGPVPFISRGRGEPGFDLALARRLTRERGEGSEITLARNGLA